MKQSEATDEGGPTESSIAVEKPPAIEKATEALAFQAVIPVPLTQAKTPYRILSMANLPIPGPLPVFLDLTQVRKKRQSAFAAAMAAAQENYATLEERTNQESGAVVSL